MVSCGSKKEKVEISFYYWRTLFQLSSVEKQYLEDLDVKKIYVRYFDVALRNEEVIPVAPIVFKEIINNVKIVPVVYIKNEVFIKEGKIDSLAAKVLKYIEQINTQSGITVDEIQFDCDWSLQSKQNYFRFIEDFRKLHSKVSATIRLHQVKYPEKTGVPNVSAGVLMYYNMGVISASDENSIYDRKIAGRYVKSLQDYDLPLSIALPIFSWGVHIRDHQVTNLIGGLRAKDLDDNHFEKIGKNKYRVLDDFLFKGRYLAKNDFIKIEESSSEDLKEMVNDIKENSIKVPKELIFYDLNENNLTSYEKEFFKTVSHW